MGNNAGEIFCLVRAVSVKQSKLLFNPIKKKDFVLPSPTKSKIIILLRTVLRIRIRLFLGLPNPLVRGTDPDPSIIKQTVRKTLIPTVMSLLYDFLSLTNYVDVWQLQKVISKKTNTNKNFSCRLEGHYRVANSRIQIRVRICTKMSGILKTGWGY